MKAARILCLTLSCVGCTTISQNIQPKAHIVDIPSLDQVTTANVGDSIIDKATVYEVDAYQLLSPAVGNAVAYHLTAQPGIYAATRLETKATYYVSVSDTVQRCSFGLGCVNLTAAFVVDKQSGQPRLVEGGNIPVKLEAPPNWQRTVHVDVKRPSFKQQLVYGGKAGSVLKFSYREFSADMARPAFSQDLSYDLADSSIVGFRSVRVEVIEATNSAITYKVKSGFQ
jgi:hypothetical protein